MRYRSFIILAVVLAILMMAVCSTASTSENAVYTSSRYITGIAVAKDHSLWVSTRGGVLHRSADGSWRKFTQADGLPSNEALGIIAENNIIATFPNAKATLIGSKWQVEPVKPNNVTEKISCSIIWKGEQVTATLESIRIGGKTLTLPPSTGSHVSSILVRGGKLWVSMFGDGIWEYDGKSWTRANVNLPDSAREITAIAGDGRNLWIGTRREGLFEFDGKKWRQHLQPDEPFDTNCQNMAFYKGNLYISTLEDGLVVRTSIGWTQIGVPDISSNAPRQMVEFKGCLYVRHGNGQIDKFDGAKWTRNVFPELPRKQASAIAADANRLYVAQWGGWSEFDGTAWTHFLKNNSLQGFAITALYPDGGKLWVGTQGRGLAEVDRKTDSVNWHDEHLGLIDDWVKHVQKSGDFIYCGTFIGGLAGFDGSKWNQSPAIGNCEITAMISDGKGGLFVATRENIWHMQADGKLTIIESPAKESQSLCLVNNLLWIGTRTGIYVVQV